MAQNSDLTDNARALAAQARLLSQSGRELRDPPEQVPGILKNLIETVHYLDDIIEVTEVAYRTHADTAVSALGNEAAGTVSAIYGAGLLKASSHEARGLREVLMRATAETDRLIWPEHDPVAAAELQEYREFLQQRAQSIEPDHDTTPAASREHGSIEPT